jgi:TonB family protein
MSEIVANPSLPEQAAANTDKYVLSSELSRLCLPAEFRDSYRTLAWVNSICFLFLVIALVGFKAPRVVIKPLSEIQEQVPIVEFTPPPEQPKQEEVKPEETPPEEAPVEAPPVAPVVAAAPSPQITFAVPVPGAVVTPQARFATPPPPVGTKVPSAPVKFDPNREAGGIFPKPEYPGYAQRQHQEGTGEIEIWVDPSGRVTEVKVVKTSGFPLLDESTVKTVKDRWRFPPGQTRHYLYPFDFHLK